ncbi:hypothetical protein GCM10029992_06910 [Glycomyces albus]
MFLEPDNRAMENSRRLADWVMKSDYDDAAKNEFFSSADFFLIAQAKGLSAKVVSQEQPSNSKRRIKIPNICETFRVKCVNTYQMLRDEGAEFVLNDKSQSSGA